MTRFGQLLAEARRKRGWRQIDAADEFLVTSRTIGGWERGEWPIPRDVAEWLLAEHRR